MVTELEMTGVIYLITNLVTNVIYIGRSVSWSNRRRSHLDQSSNLTLRQAVHEYGRHGFRCEIIGYGLEKDLPSLEVVAIARYRKAGYTLYNGNSGGGGILSMAQRDDISRKVRKTLRQRRLRSQQAG